MQRSSTTFPAPCGTARSLKSHRIKPSQSNSSLFVYPTCSDRCAVDPQKEFGEAAAETGIMVTGRLMHMVMPIVLEDRIDERNPRGVGTSSGRRHSISGKLTSSSTKRTKAARWLPPSFVLRHVS
jgi:hypothetical protein